MARKKLEGFALRTEAFRTGEELHGGPELGVPSSRPLAKIQPRAGGDARRPRSKHVISLARSISALGLLEPLVIDSNDRLLAGGHRLCACTLLATPPQERKALCESMFLGSRVNDADLEALRELQPGEFDPASVPVRVVEFDSAADIDRALAIEAAENTQRRNYSPEEIRGLYRRLLSNGFTDRPGRPRTGERAARPVLAAVVGRSERQIRNLLSQADQKPGNVSGFPEKAKAINQLQRAIQRVRRIDEPSQALTAAIQLLGTKLDRALEQALSELGSA